MSIPPPNVQDFEKYLVSEYFKHGSINKVFYHHHFNLPISYAGFDRILNKYSVIKSAGPNSKLTESLKILSLVADYKLSLEKVYERFAPRTVLVSTQTLHRVLHHIRLGLTRRQGTALVITRTGYPREYLLGRDMSLSSGSLGSKGDLSLPMGHSKSDESVTASVYRVLQQEVFTDQVVCGDFPSHTVPHDIRPIMFINIADIKVAVYHLEIEDYVHFSSYKLSGHKFYDLTTLRSKKLRPGVLDILEVFANRDTNINTNRTPEFNSSLNMRLYALAGATSDPKRSKI